MENLKSGEVKIKEEAIPDNAVHSVADTKHDKVQICTVARAVQRQLHRRQENTTNKA